MQSIVVVDAFAEAPYSGNPAAVCVLNRPAPDVWMQAVAAQMNLAETAFVVPEGDTFRLRWFTPGSEVDLCGHATLAAAHHLWESGTLAVAQSARFRTRSGLLMATLSASGITLDFPALPVTMCEPPPELLTAIPMSAIFIGKSTFDFVVEVATESEVRAVQPDFAALAKLDARGVIVTAHADAGSDYDVVSRCFFPCVGVPEDPVTGSAHCALATHWCAKLDRASWVGYQASQRGGKVGVKLLGDRVALTGRAITNWRGELLHLPN